MRVLITAGSTEVPIDRVRAIGNIFKGKTGVGIAYDFARHGVEVTLLTSGGPVSDTGMLPTLCVIPFRTFDDLAFLLEREVQYGQYDAIIHSAAVSDYVVSGVMVRDGERLLPVDNSKKIPSTYQRLYLELTPAIKLIDQIREPWGFSGTIVKFKLQVGISDDELLAIARKSVNDSRADFIVANCLEWYKERAYVVSSDGSFVGIDRNNLSRELLGVLTR